LVQRGGNWASPPRPLLAVPNATAHPSTASVPITVFLYNGPLLCGFNVPIQGLARVSPVGSVSCRADGVAVVAYNAVITE